jgi:hypothetical protein
MLMGLLRLAFHVIRGGPRTESVMNLRALTEIHQGIVNLTLARVSFRGVSIARRKTVLSDAEVRYAMLSAPRLLYLSTKAGQEFC